MSLGGRREGCHPWDGGGGRVQLGGLGLIGWYLETRWESKNMSKSRDRRDDGRGKDKGNSKNKVKNKSNCKRRVNSKSKKRVTVTVAVRKERVILSRDFLSCLSLLSLSASLPAI